MPAEPWTPAQLETVRLGMASGKKAQEIADEMGRSRMSVRMAADRYNLGKWVYRQLGYGKNIPADFAERLAEIRTCRGLARHYGAADSTISRWMQMRGLTYPPPFERQKPAKPKVGVTAIMGKPKAIAVTHYDDSIPGRAARHLQKWGPCYRDHNGWRRGNALLNDNELIERAVAKGFAL